MATFDGPLHMQAFENMERGNKTVYAVLASDEYMGISSGDRLEFGSFGSITVGTVRRYRTLESLCDAEGFQNIVPEANSAEEAVAIIRAISEWNAAVENERGVYALRVREAKRK